MLMSAPETTAASALRLISISASVMLIANTPPPLTMVTGDAEVWSVAVRSRPLAASVIAPPAQARVLPAIVAFEVIRETAAKPTDRP